METQIKSEWAAYPELPGVPAQAPVTCMVRSIVQWGSDDVLVLRSTKEGALYLWLEAETGDGEAWKARALFYAVDRAALVKADAQECTNLDLMLASKEMYLIEYNHDNATERSHLVKPEEVTEYHSKPGSYFPKRR